MPLYRRLEPFEGDGSAWPIYEEQVLVFFRANDTPRRNNRTFSWQVAEPKSSVSCWTPQKPVTPHTKTLSELLTTLRSHFSPASSTLMGVFLLQ
ncbi:hypothetical protein MRX96_026337 [Rhipicephalus microplus]